MTVYFKNDMLLSQQNYIWFIDYIQTRSYFKRYSQSLYRKIIRTKWVELAMISLNLDLEVLQLEMLQERVQEQQVLWMYVQI